METWRTSIKIRILHFQIYELELNVFRGKPSDLMGGVVTTKKNAFTKIMSKKIFMQALPAKKKILQGNEANLHIKNM